jgi:predicted Zn-dependent protease
MSATPWTMLSLDAGARGPAALPPVAWPVPEAEVARVLASPVALDLLVEYADAYSDEHPSQALDTAIARLAYMVAIDELDDHLYEHAEHHLRIGLRHAPGNVSLRSHLGLALWGLGRRDDATTELSRAIAGFRRVGEIAPMLWLLTARALDETGRHGEARPLLEELAALLPAEESFWELLAVARARAAA